MRVSRSAAHRICMVSRKDAILIGFYRLLEDPPWSAIALVVMLGAAILFSLFRNEFSGSEKGER